MNYWLFQSVPERYDLRSQLVAGQTVTWYATRYRNLMAPGDIVFFWLGGDKPIRGIYGWGKMTSEPYMRRNWQSYGVDIHYEDRFDPFLPESRIITEPALKDLLIFRARQATNFHISEDEARAIAHLTGCELSQEGLTRVHA
jgi:hypothetical protein